MNKTDALVVSQLLSTLAEIVGKLEKAHAERQMEVFTKLKKEALDLQKKIDALL